MAGFKGFRFSMSSCQGLSLVELMVALVLGLLVSLGAYQIFALSFGNMAALGGVSEKKGSLDFVYSSLLEDVRLARPGRVELVGPFVEDDGGLYSKRILITLPSGSKPYCNPGVDGQIGVEYFFNGNAEGGATINRAVLCPGETSNVAEVLVGGGVIKDLDFFSHGACNDYDGESQVSVACVEIMLTTQDDDDFVFLAVNRQDVLGVLAE